MTPDALIAAIAGEQHGVFTRAKALTVGLSRRAIAHRLHSGSWIRPQPGVYAIAGTVVTRQRDVIAAVLAFPSAYASHTTAAHIHAFIEVTGLSIHVTLPHGQERVDRRGVIVHQARTLGHGDVANVDGIPVTSTHRTIVDLAGAVPPDVLEAALDTALTNRTVSLPSLERYIATRRLDHNRGVGRLRRLMRDRTKGVR